MTVTAKVIRVQRSRATVQMTAEFSDGVGTSWNKSYEFRSPTTIDEALAEIRMDIRQAEADQSTTALETALQQLKAAETRIEATPPA